MTHDEMIAVIAAHRDGKRIEVRSNQSEMWDVVEYPAWDFLHQIYRVAPKPVKKVKMWQWIYRFDGDSINLTIEFFSGTPTNEGGCQYIQRAEWTMIEVEP